MLTTKYGYHDYFFKSLKWFLGNAFFGLFPFIFVSILNKTTPGHIAGKEMEEMVHSAIASFVLIAIMVSVLVDYLLSGIKLSGFRAFAVYIFPCIFLFIVSIQYLLTITAFIPNVIFNLDSFNMNITFIVGGIYSVVAKTDLSLREDIKHG